MNIGTTNLVGRIVISAILLSLGSSAMAEALYQWKDRDGTITYSTQPPPAEITTAYEEVSSKLEAVSITSQSPKNTENTPAVAKPVIPPTPETESRLERLVRLSPDPVEKTDPKIQETILLPVNQDKVRKQRKCRDLNNRVTALEARLSTVSSASELNESMLLLAKYQNSFDRYCQ